jgi:hypothetical protein
VQADAEGYSLIADKAVSTGAAVLVRGELVESPGGNQAVELAATSVELIGACPSDYPLQKKVRRPQRSPLTLALPALRTPTSQRTRRAEPGPHQGDALPPPPPLPQDRFFRSPLCPHPAPHQSGDGGRRGTRWSTCAAWRICDRAPTSSAR